MKKICFQFYTLALLLLPATLFSQATLSGNISDQKSGEALPGATVYLPDLKSGTVTDSSGHYEITNLPQSKITVQVTYLGYEAQTSIVDLSVQTICNFQLQQSITEINEVVITGLSQAAEKNHTPIPVTIISHTELIQSSTTNIIAALSKQPGISQVTTGPAISKPEIRGLGYNRVVVIHDGIKQEGQQWGDEHGIEADEFSVNKIEILKGPASLMYGSDAIAGVINLISTPSIPANTIRGNVLANYQTNNGQIAYSGNIAGNQNGFIWSGRYSGKMAHDYQNAFDGFVYGSNYTEQSANALLGLNKKWGYAHLFASTYSLDPGIIDGERNDSSGAFVKPIAVNDSTAGEVAVNVADFHSYDVITPHQEIRHYKIVSDNSLILGNGSLKTIIGFQQNNRKEFDDILLPEEYGLYFKLNTLTYAVHYLFPDKSNWQTAIGLNGMQQQSLNKGTEFLVPAYNLFDAGIFFTAKKSMEKLDLAGGIRFDSRWINSADFYSPENNELLFRAFHSNFSAVSGSMGATYQFTENIYGKLNLSRGYRAPNIAEIGSNGVHEGTFRYETGNPDLKAETSLQEDIAIGFDGTHISFEADLFNNRINQFIFLQKLIAIGGGDSIILSDGNAISAFKYVQGDANLAGGEFTIDIHPHPLDWLHFENSFSFVNGIQLHAADSNKYLPSIPAPKFISELRGQFKKAGDHFSNVFFSFQLENYFKQDHIYAAYDTETPTPGYTLMNFGCGTDIMCKNKIAASVYFNCSNLTDLAYQNHLSRLKYAEVNNLTGRTGVYDMGRNFSLKLIVPLYLKGES